MRNQYKVLQEKYTLEVEATAKERAIYNTKALTKDFLPTAIKIYKNQVEPIVKSWPDFDVMTDINFPHNILINGSYYQGAGAIVPAGWADMYVYGSQSESFSHNDIDAILERWFVYNLYNEVYNTNGVPKGFYYAIRKGQVVHPNSNAEFIQYLIDAAVRIMKIGYNKNHKEAFWGGAIEDWKKAQELNKKNAQATGGDWDPQGLV